MPLGIVSDEEFLSEVAHIEMPTRGRNGVKEIPHAIRALAAEETICGTPSAQVANAFGISKQSVDAYKHDATSSATYQNPNKELKEANNRVRKQIGSNALSVLTEALRCITPEKLADAKVKDVAVVAKQMSGIVNDMEPVGTMNNPAAQFVFHVPAERKESNYDIIDVTQ